MKSADIAALLVQGMQQQATGNTDIGWHTGVIETWDELTGANSIDINGSTFENLRVLSTGALQPFHPGDVVAIIRVQTQYFILGKIDAPGAGAGERIASDRVAFESEIVSTVFDNAPTGPAGPSVTMNVGTGGRVLVIHSAEFACFGATADPFSRAWCYQGVALSGANVAAPETVVTDAFAKLAWAAEGSYAATTLVTGLNPGQTTFTCKYRADKSEPDLQISVNNRVLTVMPI